MLSIGNQPSDPLCASDTPPLHRGNSSHDRPSPSPPKHELPFSDLTTSKPNFSIRSFFGPDPAIEVASCPHGGVLTFTPSFPSRNYVFTARSKDISSNWPFSSRNLQLCVKHGVKDPLPPFESSPGCTVEALDKKKHLIIINPCTEEGPSKARNINEELTEKEKRTNVPQHETQSVPTKKQCLPVTVAVPDSLQPYSGARLLGKKSKVILKLGGLSDRISTEDITSNSTVVSEAMASKICPVCKTFSSSSNTTLNAHIDQCLCEDSTPKWTASTKLGRNRIKPRRTRLMVDIYVTANHCTVEELERRNGRIWVGAASLSCPDQDSDPEPSEEKMHEISALNDVDEGCSGGGIGAVYIDSSGKKVRILSKSVGADQPRGVEGPGLRKPLKCAKKSKIPALKKKRGKADKILKLASQTHKTRVSKDFDDQEIHHEPRGGSKYLRTCNSRPQRPMVHKESGTLKRWACSKRSGLFKKVSHRDCHGQNSNSVEDESERFNKQKTFNSFEHLEDTMRMKDSMSNLQKIGNKNPFPGKRKIGSSSTEFPPLKKSHVLDSFKPPRNNSRTLQALRFYRLNKESLVSGRDSKMRMVTDLDLSGERPSTSDEIGSETGDKTTFMRLDKADESSDDTSDLSGKHDDVESTGTEFHDDSYTEESFGMATEQTSPNFSSYLNQGNLKQLYKRGSLGCVEKPPSPNFTTFADGEDSYSEDLRDDMDVNKDDVEDREYEVERIPIPGPPGSFLPSPRALGSEDFHGTSSLTTSRVLSSQERVDNDSSDSPISATSTISNPGPTAASTVKYIDPLGVTEHKSFGPNSELELSGAKVISAQQPTPSVSSEKGGNFRAGNGKSAWVPRRNDEPCCCQRKERNNPCVVLNYQESQLLRRRNASSLSTTIGTGNRVPDHLENDASRSSTTPPTPTNPVLRLMGKNLVLNKEGESLPQPELTILENFPASRVFNVSCSSGDYLAPRPEFYSLPPDNFTEAQGNSQFMKATNQHSRSMVVPNSSKEIITIDDSTDTEPDIRADLARQIGGRSWRDDNPVAAAPSFSFPYDPRVETHFPFSYKVQEPSFFGQFPGDQLRRLGSGLMNARWCSPPVVSTLQQMPPSSSTSAATRSPLPFSRRLF